MKWTTIGFGKHKGKTLPQVILDDADWFFWAYEEDIFKGALGVIYNAFLRANYFFVSADSGFGRGGFYKRVVGQGAVFHRDKVTSACGVG